MQTELVTTLTQFGMAGLIAWMWLVERRSAAAREAQLGQAHERLLEQRVQLDALIRLVSDNTRAVSAVEAGQRALIAALQAWTAGRTSRSPFASEPHEASPAA